MTDEVRIDKWLWAARFYKTRSLAQKAIANGQVHLDGQRPKPSRGVNCGQVLKIQKGDTTFVVTIKALADKRGNATVAATLYTESDEDKATRLAQADARRAARQSQPVPTHRPDKRERRTLRRIKHQE